MKTFSEMILWELEQEAKRKTSSATLAEDEGAGKLNASILRKFRYLNSTGGAVSKSAAQDFSPA